MCVAQNILDFSRHNIRNAFGYGKGQLTLTCLPAVAILFEYRMIAGLAT